MMIKSITKNGIHKMMEDTKTLIDKKIEKQKELEQRIHSIKADTYRLKISLIKQEMKVLRAHKYINRDKREWTECGFYEELECSKKKLEELDEEIADCDNIEEKKALKEERRNLKATNQLHRKRYLNDCKRLEKIAKMNPLSATDDIYTIRSRYKHLKEQLDALAEEHKNHGYRICLRRKDETES